MYGCSVWCGPCWAACLCSSAPLLLCAGLLFAAGDAVRDSYARAVLRCTAVLGGAAAAAHALLLLGWARRVRPRRYCSPRHPTHSDPWFLEVNGTL